MRYLRFLFLLIGLGLLGWVIVHADLGAVVERLAKIGVLGIAVILGLQALGFLTDTVSWQLMLTSARLDSSWLWRLWNVRLVGSVFNYVVPAASLGGEPVKAVLLKKRHGIGYHEGSASLVIARTTTLLALIAFSTVGLVLVSRSNAVPGPLSLFATGVLGTLAAGVLGFFAVQRWRIASRIGAWLAGRRFGRRLEKNLGHVRDVDDRFVGFYQRRPGRFAASLALALSTWMTAMVGTYWIMRFLGHPVSLAEAWIIESVIQLVRVGTFFIPANLGAMEGGAVLIVGALTGQPALGLAVAAVRRARKLVWVAWGLWLAWRISLKWSAAPPDALAKASER